MNTNISAWSIRRSVPTLVLFLVLTLAGLVSFRQLGIDANPNIDIPIIQVEVRQPGAGSEEMERQVTQKIEDAIAGLGNIDEIYSSVSDGYSYTAIQFDFGVDTDKVANDVRDAVSQIRQTLPQDIQEPTVQTLQYEGGEILTYAVQSDQRSIEDLSDLVDRTISPALLSVKGVAQVTRLGGVDREIRVDLNPDQLDAFGITAIEVNAQIQNSNLNLPAGQLKLSGQAQGIRTLGSADSVEALGNLGILLPGGETIPLNALGAVKDDFAEVRQSAYVNHQPVVSFAVYRGKGSLLVSVEAGVRAAIASLQDTLPKDVQLQLIFTRATDVRDAYQATINGLLLGALLAVVVVGCFLRNWRTIVITAIAIPLSIIPTFIVLQGFGYSLNNMTLLALTLAVGNLVDDAIVEIENVERHIGMGKAPVRAALDSTAEVGLAVITTTATIVAVFIPVAFMGGIPGQFFKPFGVTVAVSTLFSTLVARLVTPMMAARLLQPQPLEQHQPPRPQHCTANGTPIPRVLAPYYGLLNAALRHRFLTLAVAIAFFSLSLTLVRFIPTSLYSAGDTALSTLSVEAPPSYTLQKTEALTQTLSDQFLEHPAVDSVYVSQAETEARVVVRLKPKPQRDITRQDFEQQMRQGLQNFPDLRFSFDSEGPGGSDKALNIVFKGKNPTALTQTADQLVQQMRQIPGLVEVSSSASLVKPELLILPDREQAADLGVSVRDIATIPSLTTLGDTDANLANFDLGDRQIPIRVRLGPEFMTNISTLQTLKIPSQSGQLIPLSAVANIAMGSSPAQIERFDRSRQVTVSANLQGITLGQGLDAVYALPLFQNLPTGVTQQTAGDADIMQEVFGRFTLALGTAIVMIYAVLVLLYESFIYPLAVMAALPLSVGGTLLGLMIAQKPLDLFALIGIVLLMGLVTKNSILLVDYALMMGRRGLSLKQAVIEAGVTRLRPILMTSISTIAGMVPIALELGAGGNTRSPMAIAVIGGFSTATLLTLIVIPVCFTYVVGLRKTLHQIWSLFSSRFKPRSTSFTQRPEISPNPSTLPDASPQLKLTPAEFPPSQSKPWGNSVPEVTSLTPQRQSTMVMEAAPLEAAPLEISPHSKPNSDSAVQVVTQMTVSATKSEPESPVTAQAAGQCCFTVACIEDDFSSLCSIYQYLDETIFSIVSVEDPAVALTDLVKYQPDVILLSLSMPDVDGFEICSRLRKNSSFQGASIILLSDQYRWVQRLRAKLCGASAYLVKPVSRTQLLTKLFLLLV